MQINLNKAISIVESTRYNHGTMSFLIEFINHWAYLHTGLYKPEKPFSSEHEQVAKLLSHELSHLMSANPTSDVLGKLLSHFQFQQRGTEFYPTPPEISLLMGRLLNTQDSDSMNFNEICCGTGSLTIGWLEEVINCHGIEKIKDVSLNLEDIDPLMVKCTLLSLIFYFNALGETPRSISVTAVDSLSRKEKNVKYYMASKQEQALKKAS